MRDAAGPVGGWTGVAEAADSGAGVEVDVVVVVEDWGATAPLPVGVGFVLAAGSFWVADDRVGDSALLASDALESAVTVFRPLRPPRPPRPPPRPRSRCKIRAAALAVPRSRFFSAKGSAGLAAE